MVKPSVKIKICGLFREEDILYANQVMPDYIGFVFAKSRRQVTVEQAARLKRGLAPGIQAVGVFVDEEPEVILSCLERGIIDMAQLHGQESEQMVRRIGQESGKPVIKAVKVRSRSDVTAWRRSKADYLLFDNGQGTGQCFDWEMLSDAGREFFLAGGIHTGNIQEALVRVHPYCIDISSGAETDGVKDLYKMQALTDAVRRFGKEGYTG